MTTSERRQSTFQRAEAGSRQVVLQIGLGAVCFILGSIMAAGLSTRVIERTGGFESDLALWLTNWFFQRVWLFVLLPLTGYAIGRLTEIPPLRFALMAGFAGEIFALLLVTGMNGFEFVLADPRDVMVRIVTFFVGVGLVISAVREGRADGDEAQREADAIAMKQKAEYAAQLEAMK